MDEHPHPPAARDPHAPVLRIAGLDAAYGRVKSQHKSTHNVPILFTRHAVREGSAGDGRHRGGFGTDVAFHLRDGTAYLTLVGDRGRTGPYGLHGGAPGQPASHLMHVAGRSFQPDQLTKIDRLYLRPGDGVALQTPGGGGFGDPQQRTPAARDADVVGGYQG